METNANVIKLVEERPLLYIKCNDFEERDDQWKEVADILKTDVSFAKSRWHLLRSKFTQEYHSVVKGNSSSFKYLNDMWFLVDHINLDAVEMYSKENEQHSTELEFNITMEDLQNDSEGGDETNQFIELDLDEDSHRELAQTFEISEENSQNEYVEPIYIDECSNTPEPQEYYLDTIQNHEIDQKEVETFLEVKMTCKEESKSVCMKEESKPNIIEEIYESKTHLHDLETTCVPTETFLPENIQEISSSISQNPTSSVSVSIDNNENSRCEDTIFGELVTATLRQMQTDKKKAVKREIMNILFA